MEKLISEINSCAWNINIEDGGGKYQSLDTSYSF